MFDRLTGNRSQRSISWLVNCIQQTGCNQVVGSILLCLLLAGRVTANDVEATVPTRIHGPKEFLQQALVQSPDDARLLSAARHQLASGEEELAFQALTAVLQASHDSFLPIFADRASLSTREAAFHLLRNADFQTRRHWTQENEGLARDALHRAIATAEMSGLMQVAQQHPFTQSAFQALTLCVVRAHTSGQLRLAKALLAELEKDYVRTHVSFETSSAFRSLQRRVQEAGSPPPSPRFAGTPQSTPGYLLSLPWKQPLWQWQESIWDHTTVASAFAGLTLPENRPILTINAWQPQLSADRIFLRTPVRIICFEKLTGRIAWSLPTDTVPVGGTFEQVTSNVLKPSMSVSDVLRNTEIGLVALEDDYLFFIDHFRPFHWEKTRTDDNNATRFPDDDVNRLTNRSKSKGTRLVAVHLGPEPHVAWTAGDSSEFSYRFEVPAAHTAANQSAGDVAKPATGDSPEASDTASAAEDTVSENLTLQAAPERFIGVPLACDQRLYVLTADEEIVWLNCLTRSTGRPIWKEPLIYHEDPGQGRRTTYRSHRHLSGASLCGIDGDVVVCTLNSGIVVGTRMSDGQLLWATNLREDSDVGGMRARLRDFQSTSRIAGAGFLPIMSGHRIFWGTAESMWVHCVDTQTGKVLWKVSRQVQASGAVEGSTDHYAVDGGDQNIVLIGERHIRCLNSETGEERWLAPLQQQSGRVTSNGQQCLVPQLDGSCVIFDVSTGAQQKSAYRGVPGLCAGTLAADGEVVCVTTPLSITVLPPSRLTPSKTTPQSTSATVGLNPLQVAQRQFVAGDAPDGIKTLQTLIKNQKRSHDPADTATPAEHLLAETLLDHLASQKFAPDTAEQYPLDFGLLKSLDLNFEQRMRHLVLSPEDVANPPICREDYLPLLQLTNDWQCRADVAVWAALEPEQAADVLPFDQHAAGGVEHAILRPQDIGGPAAQIAYTKQLIKNNARPAAEMLLLNALRNTPPAERSVLHMELTQLRGDQLSDASRRIVPIHARFIVNEELKLAGDSRVVPVAAAGQVIANLPTWYSDRLFIANRNMHTVNMSNGAVSVPHPLPTSLNSIALSVNSASPGMIPVTNGDYLGAVSLINRRRPEILWWKRPERTADDTTDFTIGPVGESYFVALNSSRIECRHPLTGRLLWQQKLSTGFRNSRVYSRQQRIAGDHQLICLIGRNLKGCTRFRTSDGKRLAEMTVNIPASQSPLISGRMILFHQDGQLILRDLLSGDDLLSASDPIRLHHRGRGQLMRNQRAAVLTDAGELLVLDMQSGAVDLRCPLGPDFDGENMTGLKVLERDDHLFVCIRRRGGRYQPTRPSSRLGEPRLDFGTLYCVNRRTGELLWNRPAVPSVMPQVFGDASNLMIFWAWEHPDNMNERRLLRFGQNNNSQRSIGTLRSLSLTVVDADSGRTLTQARHLGPYEPVRCVHDEQAQTLTLYTEKSEVVVSYED